MISAICLTPSLFPTPGGPHKNGAGIRDLMDSSGIKYDFQARAVMQAARSVSMEQCRLAVRTAADTALALNSGGGNECLTDLLIKLSYGGDSV